MQTATEGASFTILLVDDEPNFRSSLRRLLQPEGFHFIEAGDAAEALAALSAHHVDVALLDVRMPGMDGLELLGRVRDGWPDVSVIMVTAFGDLGTVVEAMKAGAADFLEKNASTEAIRARLVQARRIWQLEQDNKALRRQAGGAFDYAPLVGDSPPMARLKEAIVQVGPSDASVLIEGETGTGKELVAHAIHHHSRRRDKPFVVVDCSSISESLMESELFGHVKGAYTGASTNDTGLFRSAEGGTVFLDEIGEIPLALQVKLLRVMQEREVRPVGSTKSQKVDIRVIAATNRHLPEQIKRNTFREDLYFRIAVVTLEVPPLRERGNDIALLARGFLSKIRDGGTIDEETLSCLLRHSWPGNVRELENVIQRATILSPGPGLRAVDLPPGVCRDKEEPAPPAAEGQVEGDSLEMYEKAAIVNALQKSGGARREAARILGIGEATLYRKMNLYGLR